VKRKNLAIDNRERSDATRIRFEPCRHYRPQIGLTTNRKVKPHRVYISVMQPISHSALQRRFKLCPVDQRCARLDQARTLQLLLGSAIQPPPQATNKLCALVAITGFVRAPHDLIRVR
jgi:hypothetical protein